MSESETKVTKTDQEWKSELDPERYHVLREAGTEPPFTGAYTHSKASGMYKCGACGADLFSSDTKFDSGTGWPSFTDPVVSQAVELRDDKSLFMKRTEVLCATCGSHLGHVFPDGPGEGGQRYCINSLALDLDEQEDCGHPARALSRGICPERAGCRPSYCVFSPPPGIPAPRPSCCSSSASGLASEGAVMSTSPPTFGSS